MSVKFTNNAETTLASGINSSDTSLTVASSSGFPTITTGEYFYVTLDDGTNNEIVKVTAVSGTTWTIVRAQDNTTARSFSSTNKVELRVTAGLITDAVADALASSFAKNAFTGDGTETDFTLSQSPNSEDDLIVFIEGVFQNQSTYSLSGTTLTFSTAPADTRAIVVYTVKAAVSGANLNHDQFTASGSAAFTLSIAPINENNTQVFIDGVYQQKTDYAVSGTTLTFDTAPANGAIVEVMTFTQTEVNVPAADSVTTASIADNVGLGGSPTTTTQSASDNSTKIATTAYVTTAVANIIDAAPDTLNTLNEIAAALNDDANFNTTVTNSIASKMPLAGGTFTGDVTFNGTNLYFNGAASSANYNLALENSDTFTSFYGTTVATANKGYKFYTSNQSGDLALTLDATGKVGIGTANPFGQTQISDTDWSSGAPYGTVLTVTGNNTNDANWGHLMISDSSTGTGNGGMIRFATGSTSSDMNPFAGIDSFTEGSAYGGLKFLTRPNGGTATARMTILSDGKVGIGTANPQAVLHLKGAGNELRFERTNFDPLQVGIGTANGQNGFHLTNITDSTIPFSLHENAPTNTLVIDSSGNVGIGTTNPSRVLHTEGASVLFGTTSGAHEILFGDSAYRYFKLYTPASPDYASIRTGTTDILVAHSNGKVGIGTTDPQDLLHVETTASPIASFRYNANNRVTIRYDGFDIYGGGMVFRTAGTERMQLTTSGDLLIGCTSSAQASDTGIKLREDDRIYMVNAHTSGEQLSYYGNGGYKFYVAVSGSIYSTNTSISAISDGRLKENIRDIDTGLEQVLALQPRRFDWKEGEGTGQKDAIGFVAQEVEAVLPDVISDFKHDVYDDAKSVKTSDIVPTLVKAIQEQQTIIDDLKARIEKLES